MGEFGRWRHLTSAGILAAPVEVLREITRMRGAIAVENRAERLREAARQEVPDGGDRRGAPPRGDTLAASPPSGCEKDYHLQADDHPRHTRKKASAEALAFRRVSRPVENYSEIFSTWTESPSTLPIIVTALP